MHQLTVELIINDRNFAKTLFKSNCPFSRFLVFFFHFSVFYFYVFSIFMHFLVFLISSFRSTLCVCVCVIFLPLNLIFISLIWFIGICLLINEKKIKLVTVIRSLLIYEWCFVSIILFVAARSNIFSIFVFDFLCFS